MALFRRQLRDDLGRQSPNGVPPGPDGDFWLAIAICFVTLLAIGAISYWWLGPR